jgi:hypothetical protein
MCGFPYFLMSVIFCNLKEWVEFMKNAVREVERQGWAPWMAGSAREDAEGSHTAVEWGEDLRVTAPQESNAAQEWIWGCFRISEGRSASVAVPHLCVASRHWHSCHVLHTWRTLSCGHNSHIVPPPSLALWWTPAPRYWNRESLGILALHIPLVQDETLNVLFPTALFLWMAPRQHIPTAV